MIRYWGPIPLAWRGPKEDGAEHLWELNQFRTAEVVNATSTVS